MAYGVLIESEIRATDNIALNKFAVSSTTNVAGGGLVVLTPPTLQGEDRFTATVPATGALTGLAIAYNPSEHLTNVNGKLFAGLSADPRDYTNLQGRTFTTFYPQVGDEIVVSIDTVDNTGANVVAGDFLEAKANQTTFTRATAATGATANTTAFKVEWVGVLPFPQAGIGFAQVKAFKCICVQQ